MSTRYEEMMKKYPLLYKDRNASMQVTCVCWGICCGEGWYDIIDKLSAKLEELIEALPEEQRQHFCVSQVKEKWGTLRFYMSAGTDEMWKLISEAENKSTHTCEECGQEGKLRDGGWVKCQCDHCYMLDQVSLYQSRLAMLICSGIVLSQEKWDELKGK